MLFLEHVRGEGSIARWQDRVEPLWRRLAAGCHPNRDTVAAMGAAGLRIQAIERFKPPVPLASFTPHVQGSATLR